MVKLRDGGYGLPDRIGALSVMPPPPRRPCKGECVKGLLCGLCACGGVCVWCVCGMCGLWTVGVCVEH